MFIVAYIVFKRYIRIPDVSEKKKNLGILQAKIQIYPTIAVALKERHIEKRTCFVT